MNRARVVPFMLEHNYFLQTQTLDLELNRSVFMRCSVGLQMANRLLSALELSLISHLAEVNDFHQRRVRSKGGINMDWIVAILVGALIGWLASMVAKTDGQQGALANIVIGILGASLGRWLFGGVLNIGGATAAGSFSVIGILWGVLGALILIFLLRSVRVLR
jgi:uncharacterized membrane protein YeaQ/YmgE (transglycosylase-associated protein family)